MYVSRISLWMEKTCFWLSPQCDNHLNVYNPSQCCHHHIYQSLLFGTRLLANSFLPIQCRVALIYLYQLCHCVVALASHILVMIVGQCCVKLWTLWNMSWSDSWLVILVCWFWPFGESRCIVHVMATSFLHFYLYIGESF